MKLFFLGQLAVSYAGLADLFGDVSYQAEDAWLAEVGKSSEERWHKNECQEYLLPNVMGGYWECKGNKKCALKCHNEAGVHSSVKCKSGTWKGGKGAKCPTKSDECKCKDSDKPVVKHGHWDCFRENGKFVCDLICDNEGKPSTPGGKHVTITCKDGHWWCNDVEPQCPAPSQHCAKNKLRDVENGTWKCDKRGDHCDLHCPGGVAPCAVTCNRKKCQWEYAGEPKCKDPCTKKKKKRCEETCGDEHPYCCTPTLECICDKYPQHDGCIARCDKCPKPGDGTGRFECDIQVVKGKKTCNKKGKDCVQEPDEKRQVCQFSCEGQFTGKMIICKDEKWWGNVAPDKFTCQPKCQGTLSTVDNGHWECKDRREGTEIIRDADCLLVCDAGYEPKQDPTKATCQDNGEYNHNCQARCVKSCEGKGLSPCETGKGCCPKPCGAPCEKNKKPKVAGAWWECMIDENCKETCLLKCLNGIIPTNKHGYHVSIKCDKARWWANDPCISDLCKAPVIEKKCDRSKLPNIKYGEWDCTPDQKGMTQKVGTICTLDCADGNLVHHAYECSPDGDWFKKYGSDKCECGAPCNSSEKCCKGDSDVKGHPKYNKLCEPCDHTCKKKDCQEKDLPPIHGKGRWHCATIDTDHGKEFACVVLCNGNKTKQIMTCKANKYGDCKWRGNVNGVCKCEEHCDEDELTDVKHGDWQCMIADNFEAGISTKICNLECNGAVQTSCEATCSEGGGAKGNWKYDSKITKNHCSGVEKPKDDPCLDGCLKCNDYDTPHIPNGKWDCKKKHCDLVCNDGYKTKNGKCSLKCENHKWNTVGDPHCVKKDTTPVIPPKPTCPKFVMVKNGWMECLDKAGKGKAHCMLMCNEGHTPKYCDGTHDATATYDCDTGYFSPPGPKGKKSQWACVKGSCNLKKYDNICWDHPDNVGSERP